LALCVSALLTLAGAAIAAIVILPPPTKLASYLAVFFDENTPVLACGVLIAALFARLSEARHWIVAQALMGTLFIGVALVPPLQALRVAVKNHVAIDFARYMRAPLDEGGPEHLETVIYATVDGTRLSLDVYRPATLADPEARHPAILVLHEGGWSAGDKGSAPKSDGGKKAAAEKADASPKAEKSEKGGSPSDTASTTASTPAASSTPSATPAAAPSTSSSSSTKE